MRQVVVVSCVLCIIITLLLCSYCGAKNLHASAFTAVKLDGTAVSWGNHIPGGVVSYAEVSALTFSTDSAFAAIKLNREGVVAWADTDSGGDSSAVASALSSSVNGEEVVDVAAAQWAFAALRADGSVVAWGDSVNGGSTTTNLRHNVASSPSAPANVDAIFSTAYAFCALTSEGLLYAWGYLAFGANVAATIPVLWTDPSFSHAADKAVKGVASTSNSFAALTNNGKVLSWGGTQDAAMKRVLSRLYWSGNVVRAIYSTYYSFAVIVEGSNDTRTCADSSASTTTYVVAWGDAGNGGDTSAVCSNLGGAANATLVKVHSNPFAFALLKSDGSVVTWGAAASGGDSSAVKSSLLSGVNTLYHTAFSFAAVKDTGTVIVWGNTAYGGSMTTNIAATLRASTVETITATFYAYAALLSDGSVVCWGLASAGGNCATPTSLKSQLSSGVVAVSANQQAFAALKSDGSVVCWGASDSGGACAFTDASISLSANVAHVSTLDDLNSLYDDRVTASPTSQPSEAPSGTPSRHPTTRPSAEPSSPTAQPSMYLTPSAQPSLLPSSEPSSDPSCQSSGQPSNQPSSQPSGSSSLIPTEQPSSEPSSEPSRAPTGHPSSQPSARPSLQPTLQPSDQPTTVPSNQPASQPSNVPTLQPSGEPSSSPRSQPTCVPSGLPSSEPSYQPSAEPTGKPLRAPTTQPTVLPSAQPTDEPSASPTLDPSSNPSVQPSSDPTGRPSLNPSSQSSAFPSGHPNGQPTCPPSSHPTGASTCSPISQPSSQPASHSSGLPSGQPTNQPSSQLTWTPSSCPSYRLSHSPSCSWPSSGPAGDPLGSPSAQPADTISSKPSCQPSRTPSEPRSLHIESIVALYNITFNIRGIPSLQFDVPAVNALLALMFEQHCTYGVECVTIVNMQNLPATNPIHLRTGVHMGDIVEESAMLASLAGTSFVVEMKSVLKLAALHEVDGLVEAQQRTMNETFTAPSACSNYKRMAIKLGSVLMEDASVCQFADLGFSLIFKIYKVSTAAPSVLPTHPPSGDVATPLLLVYYVLPSILLFCAVCGLAVCCFQRRQRRAAIVYAQRREQYSAKSEAPSPLRGSLKHFPKESGSKVRPRACGYDIENFGVVEY